MHKVVCLVLAAASIPAARATYPVCGGKRFFGTTLRGAMSCVACADGAGPKSSLLLRGSRYFGTTILGGNTSCVSGFVIGCGTVFAIAP